MSDLIFIGMAALSFGLGMILVNKFKAIRPENSYNTKKRDCPPHTWREHETFKDSGLVYLKCQDCDKTLSDIFGDV